MKKALLINDIQNDFLKGGSLEIPNSNEIIPYLNLLLSDTTYDQIILAGDIHPKNHVSFASTHRKNIGETILINNIPQFMWPDHCIEGTYGASTPESLNLENVTFTIQKGKNSDFDNFSAFQDNNHFLKTGLDDFLKFHEIKILEIAGLALEYGIKNTCLDSVNLGYITCLHFNGTRAVNAKPNSDKDTFHHLLQEGVSILA